MKRQSGFTLVELLVALAIFAVLSVIVASALHHTLFAYSKIKQNQKQLRKLALTEQLLRADIAQCQPRPVYDINGKRFPALYQSSAANLELTTASRVNPSALYDRSTLQRVRYQLQDHQLTRTTWPTLDGYENKKGQTEVLLTHVDTWHLSFVDNKGHTTDHWDMSSQFGTAKLPAGIILDIRLTTRQSFHGVFAIFYQKQGANS
jgi:general secretion pathway protein J